jgi:hypothetical protein
MIQLLLTLAAGLGGYLMARKFVQRRLRFVDAIQSPYAPIVAGVLGATLVMPFTLLHFVSTVTAIVFGVGTAMGTASAARAIRRADGELRRLTP